METARLVVTIAACAQTKRAEIGGSREIELTDPLGTDLRFRLTPADWEPDGNAEGGEDAS